MVKFCVSITFKLPDLPINPATCQCTSMHTYLIIFLFRCSILNFWDYICTFTDSRTHITNSNTETQTFIHSEINGSKPWARRRRRRMVHYCLCSNRNRNSAAAAAAVIKMALSCIQNEFASTVLHIHYMLTPHSPVPPSPTHSPAALPCSHLLTTTPPPFQIQT